LVLAALATGVQGVRALEMSARDRFLQRDQISDLRLQVEGLLRTYLSPSVAELMLSDPTVSDLGGRVAEVSVLFADLEGFTPMSRTMRPDEVARLLNRYFEVVVPTVIDEGGSVLSFGGDAILAVFNAPTTHADHALRAVRASLRIQEAIALLRTEPGLEHAPSFRIGVNTGEALVGNIGSDETRTFTVIGEVVNLASRLQTHADPGAVVIGPATYEAVRDLVSASRLDPVVLKGMTEPVQPYRLDALA
jgi:class 3 adenylate cyclase